MAEVDRVELLRDHAAIDLLAKRLSTLIDRQAAPEELALALDHLVQTVASHLAIENAIIYDLAMEEQMEATPTEVRRAHNEFETLKANWGEYLTSWTPQRIAAERDTFIRATRAMLPRLRDRVRLETHLLSLMGAAGRPVAA